MEAERNGGFSVFFRTPCGIDLSNLLLIESRTKKEPCLLCSNVGFLSFPLSGYQIEFVPLSYLDEPIIPSFYFHLYEFSSVIALSMLNVIHSY